MAETPVVTMSGPPWRIKDLPPEAVPTNIIEAIEDARWWGPWFQGDWRNWKVFLRALFGLPLDGEALAVFREYTGRQAAPSAPAKEAWLVIGRRGGKSRVLALIAAWLANAMRQIERWRKGLGAKARRLPDHLVVEHLLAQRYGVESRLYSDLAREVFKPYQIFAARVTPVSNRI